MTYDVDFRLTALTDAIGQVTNIFYGGQNNLQITRVTDPLGWLALFAYDATGLLLQITDVMGMSSRFTYGDSDFITALALPEPYGVTRFSTNQTPVDPSDPSDTFDGRFVETLYPDGTRDRVETNQIKNKIPESDPLQTIPVEVLTLNLFLFARNTYYWSRIACASVYGDYTKAKIYHWKHTANMADASGILENTKEPLEGRVWYDHAFKIGASAFPAAVEGTSNKPSHVGRVLDDGSTQLYAYEYGELGNVTKTVDPWGRTFSDVYAANGIDLETRQTRDGQNELQSKRSYDGSHLLLTSTDAAGQTTAYTHNSRGQLLTVTNAKNETTAYHYDANGFLTSVDGPLAGVRRHDYLRVRFRWTDSQQYQQ